MAVFLITARSPGSHCAAAVLAERRSGIITSLMDLAKCLKIPATGPAEDTVDSVLDALRIGEPFQRWLLVFDNSDRPEVVQSFLPAGTGHIIVTSRNRQWSKGARTVEVDLFTRPESLELLRRSGRAISSHDADRLADALGDLPLALEQAAAWRAQTGMPVDEYLQLLEQDLNEPMGQEVSSDYQHGVAAAWSVPLNRLRTEHPAPLQILQVCAFFGPEPISRSMFTGVRTAPVPEELAKALSASLKLNRAIGEISRYSFATFDHRNNALQPHRLFQTVLKSQLTEAERELMRHAVHILPIHGDPITPGDSSSCPRHAELLLHALFSKAIDVWVGRVMINRQRQRISAPTLCIARHSAPILRPSTVHERQTKTKTLQRQEPLRSVNLFYRNDKSKVRLGIRINGPGVDIIHPFNSKPFVPDLLPLASPWPQARLSGVVRVVRSAIRWSLRHIPTGVQWRTP